MISFKTLLFGTLASAVLGKTVEFEIKESNIRDKITTEDKNKLHQRRLAYFNKNFGQDPREFEVSDSDGEVEFGLFYDFYLEASAGIGTPLQVANNYFFSSSVIESVMTGFGCSSDDCAEIAYNYNESTSAVRLGTCDQSGNEYVDYNFTGDHIQDKFCLGPSATASDPLCAATLEFCTITGGDVEWYF